MKILLTGSRIWKKTGPVEVLMLGMKAKFPDVTFIFGDWHEGLDAIALDIASKYHLDFRMFVAEWDKFGRAAGPRRNGEMVADKPDVCYAFRAEGKSNGTDDCVYQAQCQNIPTYIIRELPKLKETIPGTKGYRYNSEVEGP